MDFCVRRQRKQHGSERSAQKPHKRSSAAASAIVHSPAAASTCSPPVHRPISTHQTPTNPNTHTLSPPYHPPSWPRIKIGNLSSFARSPRPAPPPSLRVPSTKRARLVLRLRPCASVRLALPLSRPKPLAHCSAACVVDAGSNRQRDSVPNARKLDEETEEFRRTCRGSLPSRLCDARVREPTRSLTASAHHHQQTTPYRSRSPARSSKLARPRACRRRIWPRYVQRRCCCLGWARECHVGILTD